MDKHQGVLEFREPVLGKDRASGNVDSRPIGRILVDLGKLRERDVDRVFALHRKKSLRFGEAACRLGLIEPNDVYYALSIQFNYPCVQRGQGTLSPDLVSAHDPYHPQAEAMREVRTQLLTQWLDAQRKVLAVLSAAPGDGRSYVAANLAVCFAQLGEKTLLVDADLRRPHQHRNFGLGSSPGLAQSLAAGLGLADVAERIAYFEDLYVLGAGATPPNPLELLSRTELRRVLADARRRYTVIIVDTPANARGADARLLAARADGVLLVARKNQTRLAELARLRSSVAQSGVPVLGTVLNAA